MKIRVWTNNIRLWTDEGFVDHEDPMLTQIRDEDGTLSIQHYDKHMNPSKWTVYARGVWEAYEMVNPPSLAEQQMWNEKHQPQSKRNTSLVRDRLV